MKNTLRKKYKELRNNFKDGKICSEVVAEKFLASDEYKMCKSVFTFLNFGSEICTDIIIKKALSDKKLVALPYMTGNLHEMVFIKIKSLNDLCKNKIGIYEPVYDTENIAVSDESTIIIVPGLVFDKNGYRIGYGGGYYDKYLSENKYMLSVGLAFDFQLIDDVPYEEFDVKTDMIITDRRVINENFDRNR